MKNITNKDLQRMKQLMGKTPVNESRLTSAVELVKKSPNGKSYGIVRENKKYFIKESNDGVNFDFIGGLGNITKHQYPSYEEAIKELNFMFEDFNKTYNIVEGTNILNSDIIEEKRFVLKSKKKKSEPNLDFGGDTGGGDMGGFDFGGGEDKGGDKGGDIDFDFGGGEDKGGDTTDFDFGGDDTESNDDLGGDDLDTEDDPIKSIQKMTGKLGQKIRDTEDLSSDTMKWVAKSIISALDLESMDNEDKKDIIRAVKKKEDEGSDEEFDFMDDNCPGCKGSGYDEDLDNCVDCGGTGIDDSDDTLTWDDLESQADADTNYRRPGESQYMMFPPEDVDAEEEDLGLHNDKYHHWDYMDKDSDHEGHDDSCVDCGIRKSYSWSKDDDDTVDWNDLTDEEKAEIFQTHPGDSEEPLMDWDEDVDTTADYETEGPFRKGLDSQYMMFPPEETYVDYMDDEEEYGPGDGIGNEHNDVLIDNEIDTYPYHEVGEDEDYMSDYEEDRAEDLEDTVRGPFGSIVRKGDMLPPPYSGSKPFSKKGRQLPMSDDTQTTDYMSKFNKDVKRGLSSGGRNLEMHELDSHLRKIKSKLGGRVHIDGNMVVGDFGFVKVTNKGYELHKEGSRFPETFRFDELGKLKNSLSGIDYMNEPNEKSPYMMPAPAPAKPSTKPGPDVKPGKPDTDKPSPSKRPFTPPPHITPGEEPSPKAEYEDYMDDYYGSFDKNRWFNANDSNSTVEGPSYEYEEFEYPDYESFKVSEFGKDPKNKWFAQGGEGKYWFDKYATEYGPMKVRKPRPKIDYDETSGYFEDYMDDNDDDLEMCPSCRGRGHDGALGFGKKQQTCLTCTGSGRIPRQEADSEVDEPFEETPTDDLSNYQMNTTRPEFDRVSYHYKEKFPFRIDYMDDNDDSLPTNKRIRKPMNPAPAPAKPSTKPGPDVKPGKPDTDKPSPSKRPFTPPPHITPGEEPSPKARFRRPGY